MPLQAVSCHSFQSEPIYVPLKYDDKNSSNSDINELTGMHFFYKEKHLCDILIAFLNDMVFVRGKNLLVKLTHT